MFACETLEHDDDQRAGRFVHVETMPDDTLHATNHRTPLGGMRHDAEGYWYLPCSARRLRGTTGVSWPNRAGPG